MRIKPSRDHRRRGTGRPGCSAWGRPISSGGRGPLPPSAAPANLADARIVVGAVAGLDGITAFFANGGVEVRSVTVPDCGASLLADRLEEVRSALFEDGAAALLADLAVELTAVLLGHLSAAKASCLSYCQFRVVASHNGVLH